jgi:hypothetical protein
MLEVMRRRLSLSAASRDRALAAAGLRRDYYDPASLVSYRDERLILGALLPMH